MRMFFISGLVRLLSLVHPKHANVVARPVAFLIWHISARLRTVSLKNLELCYPDMVPEERIELAKEGIYHYARNAMEIGIMWYWSLERLNALFLPTEGEAVLSNAQARGKGVIFLVPHCGSWELLSLRMTQDHNSAILYKPGDHPDIEAKLLEKRQRFGTRAVPANRRGLRVIYQYLADRQIVGILPDQEPKSGEGRFARFFGIPARTGVLVPRLAQRTGAAMVFGVCVRHPGGRYRAHILPAEDGLYSEDLDTALAALNRGVEQCIALDPAQYLWAYKRFRARPDGEERFY